MSVFVYLIVMDWQSQGVLMEVSTNIIHLTVNNKLVFFAFCPKHVGKVPHPLFLKGDLTPLKLQADIT